MFVGEAIRYGLYSSNNKRVVLVKVELETSLQLFLAESGQGRQEGMYSLNREKVV